MPPSDRYGHRLVQCRECGKSVPSNKLQKHLRSHAPKYENCTECGLSITKRQMSSHMKTHLPMVNCPCCAQLVREDKLQEHTILCNDGIDERLCKRVCIDHLPANASTCTSSSVNGFFRTWKLNVVQGNDYDTMLRNVASSSKEILDDVLKRNPVKSQITVSIGFSHVEIDGSSSYTEAHFKTCLEALLIGDDLDCYLRRVQAQLSLHIDSFERLGSGWIYEELIQATLELARYVPLAAGSYVEIPKVIKDMKSTLNITSDTNRCLLHCLIASKCIHDDQTALDAAKAQGMTEEELNKLDKKLPARGKSRHSGTQYEKYASEILMGDIQFPVRLDDIAKIEELNGLSITIVEWDVDEKAVIPLRRGCDTGRKVELLYLENETNAHYVLIKDFNVMMRYRTRNNNKSFYCLRCLYGFKYQSTLDNHQVHCQQRPFQLPRMPEEGNNIYKFVNAHKEIPMLFTIYSDSETVLKEEEEDEGDDPNQRSYTKPKQTHIPCSYSIVTSSTLSDYVPVYEVLSDEDPKRLAQRYLCRLEEVHADMMECFERNKHKIHMTPSDELEFLRSTHCYLCKDKLDWQSKTNWPVRDHDHMKEFYNYRGSAHNSCNLRYFERVKKVPVMFHNLSYDLNGFIVDLLKLSDNPDKIQIIPNNLEKFKALYNEHFIFMDTIQFLPASLSELVDNLKQQGAQHFKRLRASFPNDYELLMAKGIYPYDYVKDFKVFEETSLPSIEDFYNKLNEKGVTPKEYERAQSTWNQLGCSTFLNYMEAYVLTDALLLADVFEYFRTLCQTNYHLDPCHYLSLPGFAMDSMLRMTRVKIELLTDIDMYLFMENNLRGGITTTNHRRADANNPYLVDYNPEEEISYIQYIDMVNLYGSGLQGPLPYKDFKFLTREQIDARDFLKLDAEGERWYALEVDLEYPESLHDDHNDFPLAVQKRSVQADELSPYNQEFLEKLNEKHKPIDKLIPDLKNKTNYVCSLANLQFYVKQGLKLKKIHRVLTGIQTDWMRPYIEFNTRMRGLANNAFEKLFYKLMNNACYGKLIEDVRKRRRVTAIMSDIRAQRLVKKPQVTNFQTLDDDVTLIQMLPKVAKLEKCVFAGFQVLESSKVSMARFWYDKLKPKYGDRIKLLMSDTDSFLYHVKTNDVYEDMIQMKEDMDMSEYPKGAYINTSQGLLPLHDPTNKKIVGKMSDERPGEIIRQVIALKPKMYSVKCQSYWYPSTELYSTSGKAKGITKVAQKRITHDDYLHTLDTASTTTSTFRSIRSIKHVNKTLEFKKRALSVFDDKKFVLDGGVWTLSYGHYRLYQPYGY